MFEEIKERNKGTAIRLGLISVFAIGFTIVALFITIAQPKHSQFCAKCHSNISFNNGCKKASPDGIACIECHTHENKGNAVMAVEMRNEHCTAEVCHPLNKLSEKSSPCKEIKPFQHKTHTGVFPDNFALKCTSCHSHISEDKHFDIDTGTCNICHFINTQQPFSPQDRKAISDCTLCHGHINKSKEIYGKTFQHDKYEKNEKVNCSDCHFQTIQGNGRVDKKNCYRCHSRMPDNPDTTSEHIHFVHTDKHKTACTSCHTPIDHGWIRENNKVHNNDNAEPGDTSYRIQTLIMMGQGGIGIQGEPDPMYLATLHCSACHKDKQISTNVAPKVCNNCHDKGFDTIVSEQMRYVRSEMQILKKLLLKAKRGHSADKTYSYQQAEANYNLIREDGSSGAHNIKYIKNLLEYSIASLKHDASVLSDTHGNQDHISIPVRANPGFHPYGEANERQFTELAGGRLFSSGSCTDKCHVNYEAYRTVYQKEAFRHKTHSPEQGLECNQCHNNDPVDTRTHGDLIIQKKDCWDCHHKKTREVPANSLFTKVGENASLPPDAENCLRCHTAVKEYREGSIEHIGAKMSDWMSQSVSCGDCHKLKRDESSFKAVRESCIECHNHNYGLLYDAWKETLGREVKKISANKADIPLNMQISLKLVQFYGMHNFRLSQLLLNQLWNKYGLQLTPLGLSHSQD